MLSRHRVVVPLTIFIVILFTFIVLQSQPGKKHHIPTKTNGDKHAPENGPSLPPIYQEKPAQSMYCEERFGVQYLQNLSESAASYCDAASTSTLTCFDTVIDPKKRVDAFCVGGPVTIDKAQQKFQLDCETNDANTRLLRALPKYWYQTGPSYILKNNIKFSPGQGFSRRRASSEPKKYGILVKREASNYNLWHSIMEVLSVHMTLDVLRMSKNPATNESFFSPDFRENVQVIILDDFLDGPIFDLWSLYASTPPIRLSEIADKQLDNVLVPLPGGSNPFWQGDWHQTSCQHSELLRVFSQRVFDFYNIAPIPNSDKEKSLNLTFIDRKNKRKLVNQDLYIERLKSELPHVNIKVVDFAKLAFKEQLRIVQSTDILIGVHGAGLTHEMFLQPGSTVVEILPPNIHHKGFRNLANQMGHRYFSTHGTRIIPSSEHSNWQEEDVFIEEERFAELVQVAAASMYHRGSLDLDVN